MKRGNGRHLLVWLVSLFLIVVPCKARAETEPVDLTPRLQEIYNVRATALLSEKGGAPSIAQDYLSRSDSARWALDHEKGKLRYVEQWVKNRGIRLVEAKPSLKIQMLKSTAEKARFYVAQTLQLGYAYPGEETVNRFGVGTRHIIELRREGARWLIAMEWYTDPLGDDTEVPDVMPALAPEEAALLGWGGDPTGPEAPIGSGEPPNVPTAGSGYDREGAVKYADEYCGLAWGCGNNHRYNLRFRDYNGVGGDCTHFISQALQQGGKLNLPLFTRVDGLSSHLQYSGRASLVAKATFQALWKRARSQSGGFEAMLRRGDLIAYQEKGKLVHFGIVTGFDSSGYPLVNTHTADRYRVPFDLGWDRKTVYWLFKMRD
jgi:hypothetical protein